MARTSAEIMIDRLIEWGVEVVFGIPGDGINGIIEAFRTRQDRVQFIQVRHEEAAAFMACGYAKFTGKLGVCIATSGPGGIHLLNGLYDAKMDGAPVLALTGLPYHDLIGTHTQQDVELDKLFSDVAVFNQRVMGPSHVEPLVDLACRTALARRGVAHLTMPVDLQERKIDKDEKSKRNQPHHSAEIFRQSARLPGEPEMRLAADLLNQAKKPVILAGQGALGASDELEQTADRLAAPIIKALLGKGAIDDESPYTTGGIGLLGTKPSHEALGACDALLMVGSSFPYLEFLPKPGSVPGVQIDIDPMRIGLRYPMEVGLVGDAKRTLQQLIPMLQHKQDRSFLEEAQENMRDWRELMAGRAPKDADPMKPQLVAAELGKRLAADAIVSSDSGTITTWWARHIQARRGQRFSCSGTLATMACGLPYAIAAQVAYPGRQCVAFVGDGGLSMLMAELATCVKYKLPVKVVVISNNTLGQIKWEQMVMLGNPEYVCELQPIDFAKVAEACGATGIRVDKSANCGEAMDRALAHPGPVVVDAIVDPLEPPMPPMISAEQAKHFAEALARGTKDRMNILKTIMSDRIRELV
jgi:pyruvate dehydrogenase (quinone)/pyruvate oxidase